VAVFHGSSPDGAFLISSCSNGWIGKGAELGLCHEKSKEKQRRLQYQERGIFSRCHSDVKGGK
jgi:hypothetical protein